MATIEQGLKKELPHLPKRSQLYQGDTAPPLQPGAQDGKRLPQADWRSDLNQLQLVHPAPAQEGQLASRREHQQHGLVSHGMPWFEHESKVHIPEGYQPPPMFASQPKRSLTLKKRSSRAQKGMYRMDSGIDPVELICTRLDGWRLAIKDLVAFFKNVYNVEASTSKGYCKATSVIHVPFRRSEGLFLESGGVQDVWATIQNYAMERGVLHKEYGNFLDRAILPSLRNIKEDIKKTIAAIRRDRSLHTSSLYESRMQVDRLVGKLDQNIKSMQQDPSGAFRQTDPFLVNLDVIHAIKKLYTHENTLHEDVLRLQREIGIYEQRIILQTRATLQQLQDYRVQNKIESSEVMGKIMRTFDAIQPDKEWNEFVRRRQGHLVAENSAYKTEGIMHYPNQDNLLVHPGKIGTLQRKSGMMRHYVPGLYILTPGGFLHGYKSETQFQDKPCRPDLTLFLPHMTVSSASHTDQPFAFELRGTHRRMSHLGTEKSVVLAAQSQADYLAWNSALNTSAQRFEPPPRIDYSQRQLPALPPPPSENAPASASGVGTGAGAGAGTGAGMGAYVDAEDGNAGTGTGAATASGTGADAGMHTGGQDVSVGTTTPVTAEASGLRRHQSKLQTTSHDHTETPTEDPVVGMSPSEEYTGQETSAISPHLDETDPIDSSSFQSPIHSPLPQEQITN